MGHSVRVAQPLDRTPTSRSHPSTSMVVEPFGHDLGDTYVDGHSLTNGRALYYVYPIAVHHRLAYTHWVSSSCRLALVVGLS